MECIYQIVPANFDFEFEMEKPFQSYQPMCLIAF